MNVILSRAVWTVAAMLCVLTYAAMLGCADGQGIRAMSDRWCAEHGSPRPQCVQP